MNLLALLTDGFGADGGIAAYNRNLMTAVAQSAAANEIVVLPRFGDRAAALPPRVVQLPAAPGRAAWIARAIAIATRRRFDAIFCGHLNAAPLAAWLARLTSRPLWIQAHGVEAWSPRGSMARHALEQARLVTAVSRHTRARLLGWSNIDPSRVRVLPNTVDAVFASDTAARAGDEMADLIARHGLQGKRIILTVGRLSRAEGYKGQDRVIEALPDVLRRCPDAMYLVVGSGDDAPRLRQIVRQFGMEQNVVFAGYVGATELPAYIKLAHVFAMPSTGEGFGIVFLEAVASGLPVIAGNRDGSTDALADGALGTLIDPDSRAQLAAAMIAGLEGRLTINPAGAARFAFANFARHVDELVRHHL